MGADPFVILQQIERRYQQGAIGLPMQSEAKEYWSGIGFRFGRWRFLAPLGEVVEILPYPPVARVPMTKGWVKGVANVRGNLLPIMDLHGFFFGAATTVTPLSRVLAVRNKDVFSGLLVEEVLGLQHFADEERATTMPTVSEQIKPYLRRAFVRDGDTWGVFSFHKLADTPDFLQASL